MKNSKLTLFDELFKDKQGRLAIWQKPNLLLFLWIISVLLIKLLNINNTTGYFLDLLTLLRFGFIFSWSWLELTNGSSYFRRLLGLIILILILLGAVNG